MSFVEGFLARARRCSSCVLVLRVLVVWCLCDMVTHVRRSRAKAKQSVVVCKCCVHWSLSYACIGEIRQCTGSRHGNSSGEWPQTERLT